MGVGKGGDGGRTTLGFRGMQCELHTTPSIILGLQHFSPFRGPFLKMWEQGRRWAKALFLSAIRV